ncbi:MAG: FAD:protein FMN transferase [Chloroflexota bacterium]
MMRASLLLAERLVPSQVTREFRAMGCQMAMTVEGNPSAALFDAGISFLEQVEATLSRFRPASELSRLNARAGQWVRISPLLESVLRVAVRAAAATDGMCTPTMLDALVAAGYDRDFGQVAGGLKPAAQAQDHVPGGDVTALHHAPRHVSARRLRAGRPAPGGRTAWRQIRFSTAGDAVKVPAGVHLDLAGVAKGWSAERVADILAGAGPCLVDAGGDITARGAPTGLPGWAVDVASPLESAPDLATVYLRDVGIATSGTDYRRWRFGESVRHHLIDPRTCKPSTTDVLSATVIAPTALQADIHAKVALLLGIRRGLEHLSAQNLAGLLVHRDGHCFTTRLWSRYANPTIA